VRRHQGRCVFHLFADMTDHLSSTARSALMASVLGKNTQPEIVIRKLVHALGFRFRLHRKSLPGCPDLVFPSKRKVVFVHGCFWHRHKGCKRATTPKTHTDFWLKKFESNTSRDQRNLDALSEAGWGTLVIWECSLKDIDRTADILQRFLSASPEDI
jgi:DNA mismatch endonuclease (patch repair protein)